jgi:5'-nucleotidase
MESHGFIAKRTGGNMTLAAVLEYAPPGTNVPTAVMTKSGHYFDFMNPNVDHIELDDIAHSLSNLCRYTGHCAVFYSVAQHSVLMARRAHEDVALEVLMHDAAEAYLGDIATPLKQCLPYYRKIEATVEKAIGEKFLIDISEPITKACIKELDWQCMATEVRDLMPENADWTVLDGIEPFGNLIVPWTPREAYNKFLEEFRLLS